jgi:hypothetical protein
MGDPKRIQDLVEQAVGEALSNELPGLRDQIVRRVLERLADTLAPVATGDCSVLNEVQAAVQSGTTQVQILDAMVEGASRFAARTALYVVRGTNAVGWRARGFADDEAVRNCPLELAEGMAAQAIQGHMPVTGPASEFVSGFADRFGAPSEPAVVYPLVVRDKVVAVIYTDGGTAEHRFDRPAMEALVRSTGLWLEVFATRKMGGPAPMDRPSGVSAMAAAASAAATAAKATAANAAPSTQSAVAVEPPPPMPAPVPAAPAVGEDEIQKKARRFAKLLVDEIKLYNQSKVSEGRHHRDLYDRLKDDIEKSRASYEKRYGNSAARDGDYFNHELVRILADNDPSLMGGNFPR